MVNRLKMVLLKSPACQVKMGDPTWQQQMRRSPQSLKESARRLVKSLSLDPMEQNGYVFFHEVVYLFTYLFSLPAVFL